MNKPTLSLSEIAHRIVLERRFNKMIAEITSAMKASTQMLNEAGLPSGVEQGILKASKEVENAGEDVADEDVQAAMLMAALEKGGDVSKVSATDVEAAMEQGVKEAKQPLRESENVALMIVETIALVLGNAALVEGICAAIEKITGKKADPSKFTQGVNKIAGWIKKITGFPMKVFGDTIAWIIKKLGGGESAQKIGKYSVKLVAVIAMFWMGWAFFPLAGVSVLGVALSVTGMLGKGFEIGKLGYELFLAIKKAVQDKGGAAPAPAMA